MTIASASFSRLALRLLAGLAACAALASPAHAGPVLNRIQATGVFKMGYRPNGVPFSWETSPGAATGYAPDICQRIAAGIAAHLKLPKLQVQAVPVLESTRIPAVVNGEMRRHHQQQGSARTSGFRLGLFLGRLGADGS